MKHHSAKNGFIALMSAIIISAILLSLVITSSTASFYARYDAQSAYAKRAARAFAEACANTALLRLSQNYAYAPAPGGDAVAVGEDNCTIQSVSAPDAQYSRTVVAYASDQGSFSTITATAMVKDPSVPTTSPPVVITSWQER